MRRSWETVADALPTAPAALTNWGLSTRESESRDAVVPLARNSSRQVDNVAAVTPRARERVSRSSPRSSRTTASALRRAEKPPKAHAPSSPSGHSFPLVPTYLIGSRRVSNPTLGRESSSSGG